MRRVIRSIRTHEFFSDGKWTLDPALAQDFPDTLELLKTCAKYHLQEVELALQLDHEPPGACGLRVPLPVLGQLLHAQPTGSPGLDRPTAG